MWSKSREQFCPLLWKLLPVKIEADQQLHWVCFAFFYLLAVAWEESHGVWFSTPTVKALFTGHMITQYVPLGRTWTQLSLLSATFKSLCSPVVNVWQQNKDLILYFHIRI